MWPVPCILQPCNGSGMTPVLGMQTQVTWCSRDAFVEVVVHGLCSKEGGSELTMAVSACIVDLQQSAIQRLQGSLDTTTRALCSAGTDLDELCAKMVSCELTPSPAMDNRRQQLWGVGAHVPQHLLLPATGLPLCTTTPGIVPAPPSTGGCAAFIL